MMRKMGITEMFLFLFIIYIYIYTGLSLLKNYGTNICVETLFVGSFNRFIIIILTIF